MWCIDLTGSGNIKNSALAGVVGLGHCIFRQDTGKKGRNESMHWLHVCCILCIYSAFFDNTLAAVRLATVKTSSVATNHLQHWLQCILHVYNNALATVERLAPGGNQQLARKT